MKLFHFFPNPSNSEFEIVSENTYDKVNIYSISGIKQRTVEQKSRINMADLIGGVYIIELEWKGKSIGRQKLIKI
ncbi:MAG: T9SS type A sorting domain-containing protein [Saprospiraceae bacterium]|nr:T9SS type A sorting domain-containing protein [Saprospiraceae bacterium]